MKNSLKSIAIGSLFLVGGAEAFSESNVEILNASFSGNGCENEDIRNITLSNSRGTDVLGISFQNFNTFAGGNDSGEFGPRQNRSTCLINLQIKLPRNQYMEVYSMEYLGFADVPRGARVDFQAEVSFGGTRSEEIYETYSNYQDAIQERIPTSIDSRSDEFECPSTANLFIDSSLFARTNSNNDYTAAWITYGEFTSQFLYKFRTRICR